MLVEHSQVATEALTMMENRGYRGLFLSLCSSIDVVNKMNYINYEQLLLFCYFGMMGPPQSWEVLTSQFGWRSTGNVDRHYLYSGNVDRHYLYFR